MKTATQGKRCNEPPVVPEQRAGADHLRRPARRHPVSGLSTPSRGKSLPAPKGSGDRVHVEACQEDFELVREFAHQVRARLGPGVVAVRWFGSRRAGGAAPDSDVDILLETETPLSSAERDLVLDTSVEMAAAYGCALDVHYYTSRELRSQRFRRTPFILSVLSEGAVV